MEAVASLEKRASEDRERVDDISKRVMTVELLAARTDERIKSLFKIVWWGFGLLSALAVAGFAAVLGLLLTKGTS